MNFWFCLLLLPLGTALAAPIEVRIRNNRFVPNQVKVKAGERFQLQIINEDPTMKEFESNTMMIEKFLTPPPSRKSKITVTLGPLKPGTYEFFDEFNMKETQGVVIAQ